MERNEIVAYLIEAKCKANREWEEIVASGVSSKSCGHCPFVIVYHTVHPKERNIHPLCWDLYGEWLDNPSNKNAKIMLEFIRNVDVEEWVDKLLLYKGKDSMSEYLVQPCAASGKILCN